MATRWSVARQIMQYVFRPAERLFSHTPPSRVPSVCRETHSEDLAVPPALTGPVEGEPLAAKGVPQSVQKLRRYEKTGLRTSTGRKNFAERSGSSAADRTTTRPRGHNTMDVRVTLQGLAPGMENAQEADLRSEVLGIGGDFQEGCGAGSSKQELEQNPLVLPRQRNQLSGDRRRPHDSRLLGSSSPLACG